jgi:hypothetical protein
MAKQKQLVLQHLEAVSWRVLEEYPDVVKELIRGRAGIYVLYSKEKLYYVGLAGNLMGRLKTHLKDRHRASWDRFSVYLTVLDEHMKELESLLLRITAPRGNKTGGKFASSTHLLPMLLKSMKESDAKRHARLLGGHVATKWQRSHIRRARGSSVLAGVVERTIVLKANHKGKRYIAKLHPDGTIKYKGKSYDSPKAAALAAARRRVKGWHFWMYKVRGSWVPLSTIKR